MSVQRGHGMAQLILAVDQGTTSTKALLVDRGGAVVGQHAVPLAISSPRTGWVEQDADELWGSVRAAIAGVMAQLPAGAEVLGLAISNQRETVVGWDAETGRPVAPAISWQDQRGDAACRELAADPANLELVQRASGLELGSMFSASKLAWFEEAHGATADLRLGTVDTWLLDRLTGGATYATEAGNAGRTLLLDIASVAWSPEVAALFGLDVSRLAEVRPSTGPWGTTRGVDGLPDGTPILAVLGDSHAALYGHWALAPEARGVGKATYGTGSSVMLPVAGPEVRVPGVATTLAWQTDSPQWALEGNILYSGAGLDWLARTIGCPPGAALTELAATAGDSGGAVFVPALNGLGAPWWDASAVGCLVGLTVATSRAQIALAGLESVAHQVADVVGAMDPDRRQPALHAGGGATTSALLMQTQADLLGRDLLISGHPEISAVGAAALAFEALGLPLEPAPSLRPRRVTPQADVDPAGARAAWLDALARAGVNPNPS